MKNLTQKKWKWKLEKKYFDDSLYQTCFDKGLVKSNKDYKRED